MPVPKKPQNDGNGRRCRLLVEKLHAGTPIRDTQADFKTIPVEFRKKWGVTSLGVIHAKATRALTNPRPKHTATGCFG